MLTKYIDPVRPWWGRSKPTVRYLMETEAHVYALAVSASVLLSFYPFVTVMISICNNILHWPAAVEAIYIALNDYFPGGLGDFIRHNPPRHAVVQWTSLFLLLFTANGVFEPLEVALNRAWGVTVNRTYLRNQMVALGMIFACGGLALLSLMLTGLNSKWLSDWTGSHASVAAWLNLLIFKIAALPLSILALFLVYWLLPNRKVDPVRVAPVALVVGVILEVLKYVNLLLWPPLANKLDREYNIFKHSVTILLWSFVAALIVLAGAEWTARHDRADPLS
ncbi:MAG TPA: YihY/virulence factor BrkB family protein [Candidatus Limnocylindrales bacterium]|nr:YihY/virulence factor BrkB family protein [Candidatus Limnocylindrales bacterium]